MPIATRLLNAFWIAFGLSTIWYSTRLGVWTPAGPDVGFFPVVAGFLVTISGASLVVHEWSRPRVISVRTPVTLLRVAAVLGGMIVMAVLMKPLGFVMPVFLATIFFVLIVEPRRWVAAIIMGLTVSLLTYFVFIRALGLPFPRGVFGM